jgi:predicted DNA-binding transcriptional regulator AlpA
VEKNILTEFELAMTRNHIKIPAIAVKLGIPKERIYKWYQEGTKPKAGDAAKIWKWINGEKEENEENMVSEPQEPYGNLAACLRIIESQQRMLESQQETIRYLTTGKQATSKAS